MRPVTLLDVNLLMALLTAGHVHHELAHDWFADQRAHGWATCPLTENGFVRIMGQRPRSTILRPDESVAVLRTFTASGHHRFWSDSLSLTAERVFQPAMIKGPRQVTDVYLLGLAKHHGGALATLDESIQLRAVTGATKAHLVVISAAPGESTPGDR